MFRYGVLADPTCFSAFLLHPKCPQNEVEVVVAEGAALHSSMLEVLALKVQQLFLSQPTKEVVAGGEVGHKEGEEVWGVGVVEEVVEVEVPHLVAANQQAEEEVVAVAVVAVAASVDDRRSSSSSSSSSSRSPPPQTRAPPPPPPLRSPSRNPAPWPPKCTRRRRPSASTSLPRHPPHSLLPWPPLHPSPLRRGPLMPL